MDSNNMNVETTNTTNIGVTPPGGEQGKAKGKLDSKVLAVIAVVAVLILVILIPTLVKASTESKVKKAVKTYVQVFMTGDKRASDIKWTKYYPKFLDRDVEDWADDYYDDLKDSKSFEDVTYKVLSISKVGGKDMKGLLEDEVEGFFLSRNSRYFDLTSKDLRDLKISNAYVVVTQMDVDGDMAVVYFLVVKANGRYGVYDLGVLFYED